MTTTITQFTGGHNGSGGAPIDREDTVAIGGTAAAGDWLHATTTGGADGGGLGLVVVTDNISGATGWEVDFDVLNGAGSDQIRVMGWRKLAVGGETTVVCTWPAASNHCMVGFWAHNLTQPYLYLIDSGDAILDSGFMRFTAAPGSIQTNAETYVGGVAFGRGGATRADFESPPSPTTEGGSGTLVSGAVGVIEHYNNDEAGTTADTLIYQFQPPQGAYMFWYGFSSGPPAVELAGTGRLALGGTGELTISGGKFNLAGTGRLALGGAGLLHQEGGQQPLAGSGGLFGGRGRLSAPAPYPPVPNLPAMTGQLGCGLYDVFVFTRGLGTIAGRIPFNLLNWTRVLDDTSSAEVTVNGVSNTGPMQSCCQLLGSIEPWKHELGIYRNGLRVWSGPVVKVSFPSETVIIDCLDLSAWLQIRNLHDNHNFVAPNADLADNWVALVEDAMSVDNTAGLYALVQALTGIQGERLYTQDMHVIAADAISELARTGLDWSCVDRRMVGGPVAVQPPAYPDAPAIPTLTDESFRDAPTVERDGNFMGNAWYVNGMGSGPGGNAIFGQYGPHFPATPDHVESPAAPDYAAIKAEFGRIERIVNETKILDQPSIDQNAATRYDLTKRPVDVISQGTLLPTAGIDIRQLLPGSIQNLHLTRACVAIGSPYRLKQLTVTAQGDGAEQVDGAWEPVGSVAAHEDL